MKKKANIIDVKHLKHGLWTYRYEAVITRPEGGFSKPEDQHFNDAQKNQIAGLISEIRS
jgi:16S rRNA U1498 N3-methylase RsmE